MKVAKNAITPILLTAALIFGCVRVEPPLQRGATLKGDSVDQVLAIVIDTSGSFENAWEGKAYPFLASLIETYFHQSLGTESVLQIAVLSEAGRPVFWIASPRDFGRAFPSERHFLERLAAEKQIDGSPIYGSIVETIKSVRSTARLRTTSKATVVVLSDLVDTTEPPESKRQEGKQMIEAIKRFTDDGGNVAFYYADTNVAIQLRDGLEKQGVSSGRYWIEGKNVFLPTPPNFY